jgi:hypothetical protein
MEKRITKFDQESGNKNVNVTEEDLVKFLEEESNL